MYCWLLLQIYLCCLWLLLCSRVTYSLKHFFLNVCFIIIYRTVEMSVHGKSRFKFRELFYEFFSNNKHSFNFISRTHFITLRGHKDRKLFLNICLIYIYIAICCDMSFTDISAVRSCIMINKHFCISHIFCCVLLLINI